jgi:hypothetical protein
MTIWFIRLHYGSFSFSAPVAILAKRRIPDTSSLFSNPSLLRD